MTPPTFHEISKMLKSFYSYIMPSISIIISIYLIFENIDSILRNPKYEHEIYSFKTFHLSSLPFSLYTSESALYHFLYIFLKVININYKSQLALFIDIAKQECLGGHGKSALKRKLTISLLFTQIEPVA